MVTLEVVCEIKTTLAGRAMEAVISEMSETQIAAFNKRCAQLYPPAREDCRSGGHSLPSPQPWSQSKPHPGATVRPWGDGEEVWKRGRLASLFHLLGGRRGEEEPKEVVGGQQEGGSVPAAVLTPEMFRENALWRFQLLLSDSLAAGGEGDRGAASGSASSGPGVDFFGWAKATLLSRGVAEARSRPNALYRRLVDEVTDEKKK